MKEQIRLLQKLQTIDSRTEEIRRQIVALPERLKPAQQDHARLAAMLEAERTKIAETETWRKEQEALIKTDNEGVRAAKLKLAAAKSARDYAMANREIDNKRRSISSREEEVLKIIEAMESKKTSLEAQEAQVAEIGDKLAAEKAVIDEQVVELEARATESTTGRDEIAEQVDKALLRKYESVIKRRGVAMVPVENGDCGGCHMQIPPQLNNIIARGESIEVCPACYRLLYRKELVETD